MSFFIGLNIQIALGDMPSQSGGGNFTNGKTSAAKMDALLDAGGKMPRVSLYPGYYYKNGSPSPSIIDDEMRELHSRGLTPMILFEFYHDYTAPPRTYQAWYDIGVAFAQRFRPGSSWNIENGHDSSWGIQVYSAINEPDIHAEGTGIDYSDYHDMLEGLADGVHSVDGELEVIPGGFARENSHSDHDLRGYGPAIADLLNDGTLAGIDLHVYNDIIYAPIVRSNGSCTFSHSPQRDFEEVKEGSGITRDINFYSTEYSFKNNTQGISDDLAAKRMLTCMWAIHGVVKDNGERATQFALMWNIYNTEADDPTYGKCTQLAPWTPIAPGKTVQLVHELSAGMEFTALDPNGDGDFVLEGDGKKMWVWQNYPNWSDINGTSYTIDGIPADVDTLYVYRYNSWDAPCKTVDVTGDSMTLYDLNQKETYMFLAYTDGVPTPPPPPGPTPDLSGWWYLKNKATSHWLDTGSGGDVQGKSSFSTGDDRKWRFVESGSFYNVDNQKPGRGVLDTGSNNAVKWKATEPVTTDDDKLWEVIAVDADANEYRIRNKKAGREYLECSGSGTIQWNTGGTGDETVWILSTDF